MSSRHKLLLLDDDPDMLEIYREILQRLPGEPGIQAAMSGSRAIAALETDAYSVFITDLSMPKMDGLQVLAVVRRRWPQIRTVVMTSMADEQFKRRAYSMGADLYCAKPSTSQEIENFLSSVQSLIRKEGNSHAAVTGAEKKSLTELLRMECLSRNSSVVRCMGSSGEGRIWVQRGEVIDAIAGDLSGEAALENLLAVPADRYDLLPGDPTRPRRIFEEHRELSSPDLSPLPEPAPPPPPPTRALRLGPLQARPPEPAPPTFTIQEPSPPEPPPPTFTPQEPPPPEPVAEPAPEPKENPLAEFARMEGVELLLSVRAGESEPTIDSWGVEHPDELALWAVGALDRFRVLGEHLNVGPVANIEGMNASSRFSVVQKGSAALCIAFRRSLVPEKARECLKTILSKWAS